MWPLSSLIRDVKCSEIRSKDEHESNDLSIMLAHLSILSNDTLRLNTTLSESDFGPLLSFPCGFKSNSFLNEQHDSS